MSGFTRGEVEYMRDRRLGQLATVNEEGRPRGVEVWGRAGALEGIDGPGSEGALIRIFPERIVGWGIASDAPGPNARSVPG